MGASLSRATDMKIQTFIAVAALTCGAAFAQTGGSVTGSSAANDQSTTPASSADRTSGGPGTGVAARTRNAMHRMGQKTRSAMHRIAHPRGGSDQTQSQSQSMNSDTQTMGAADPSDATSMDQSRRSRMDQAYASWNARHQ
jgi:hypothetical protein